jgi:uncharacterized protein YukE
MMEHEKSAQQAAAAQKELLDACRQATHHWLNRMQSEMALWANLGPKLATTRSIPEAYEVYVKCVSQQMKMSTEDTQHLLNDLQQMTQKITQSFGSGMWPTGGT